MRSNVAMAHLKDTDRAGRVLGAHFEHGFSPSLGARVEEGGTRFRVYATSAQEVLLRLYQSDGSVSETLPLVSSLGPPHSGEQGMFEVFAAGVGHGALYKIMLEGRELPDPYALYLPEGVHGCAMVYGSTYEWRHGLGVHRPLSSQVLYELHVGTFTEEGTFAAAESRLRDLAHLGVTAVQLMPISAFPGSRGWGYDGVAHFAPHAAYGSPDELRHFIDEAHGLGLSVLLDVVYNHFGPDGNYLGAFSADYFAPGVKTPWGAAPNYRSDPMRRYLLENAHYLLTELRFDGLRLDAVHQIHDPPDNSVLGELVRSLRHIEPKKLLVAEDDRNDPSLVTKLGLDGIWADDFHHQLRVTLTQESDGYYAAYRPGAIGVADAIRRGWLYEGQVYSPTGKARGASADALDASSFVYCIQNHDQIGNRALGERLPAHVPLSAFMAASALLLFLPMTPLLFMGQEWAASSPFLYFTDHEPELGALVSRGRREEFAQFQAFTDPKEREAIPDPQAWGTFVRSKLDWSERRNEGHAKVLDLYGKLLRLRRQDTVLSSGGRDAMAVRSEGSLLVVERWAEDARRTLLVNLADVPAAFPALDAPFDVAHVLVASEHGVGGDHLGGWAFVMLAHERSLPDRPVRHAS